MDKFYKRVLKETFIKRITNESLRKQITIHICEGYDRRVLLKKTQKEYAYLVGMSLNTVKQIELGNCFNVELISKYLGS